jgi:hypothetical protein
MKNFVATIEKPTLKAFQKIGKAWQAIDARLVPCKADAKGKKAAVAKDWQNIHLNHLDLADYKDLMTMLGVCLDNLIVVDVDGKSAIAKLEELGILDGIETLTISSTPGERFALFFYLPQMEGVELKSFTIKTGKSEQLEFRTGNGKYQIIAGIHPKTGSAYLQSGTIEDIIEAPISLLEFILNQGRNENPPLVKQKAEVTKKHLTEFLSQESKEFFANPVEGGRNSGCFELACQLLGLESDLSDRCIPYDDSDTPHEIYLSLWDRIPDKETFPIEEFNKCWESANSKPRTIAQSPDYLKRVAGVEDYEELEELENCQESEEVEDSSNSEDIKTKPENKRAKSKTKLEKDKEISEQDFKDLNLWIDNILIEYPNITKTESLFYITQSEQIFGEWAKDITRKRLDFESRFSPIQLSDLEKADKIKENQNISLSSIELEPYLKSEIFSKIKKKCDFYKMPIDFALMSLFTSLSALVPKSYKFNWNGEGLLAPSMFTLLVGKASYGKDIVFNDFSLPLVAKAEAVNNEVVDYEKQEKDILSSWKTLTNSQKNEYLIQWSELNPEHFFDPSMNILQKRDLFLIANGLQPLEVKPMPALVQASIPKINQIAGEQPNFGFLLTPSEIVDFIKQNDTINKNKEGLNPLIPMWNGGSSLSNFKTADLKQKASSYQVSLLTGIQTDRFKQYFDKADPSGVASRCLYLYLKRPINIPNADKAMLQFLGLDTKFRDSVAEYYEAFQQKLINHTRTVENDKEIWKPLEIQWRHTVAKHENDITDAQRIFYEYRDSCVKRADNIGDKNQSAEQWLRRLPENCAKLIMNIHFFRHNEGLTLDLLSVDFATVELAIKMCKQLELNYQSLNECIFDESESFDDDVFMLSEFAEACKKVMAKKKVKAVKVGHFSGMYILEKKAFLERYADKFAKRLQKEHITNIFKDMQMAKMGNYNAYTGEFTLSAKAPKK